jgi:hypothetical protein
MFAKTITDERSSGKKYKEGDANNVSCICREIRGCVKEPKRNLIILKTFEIDALNTLNADNMANKGKWGIEIGKRLGKNFNYDVFSDVVLPVTFNQNWVILILNFEKRTTTVVYFKRETAVKPLELFTRVGLAIWRAGCKGGLKSLGGKWYVEKKHVVDWTRS